MHAKLVYYVYFGKSRDFMIKNQLPPKIFCQGTGLSVIFTPLCFLFIKQGRGEIPLCSVRQHGDYSPAFSKLPCQLQRCRYICPG